LSNFKNLVSNFCESNLSSLEYEARSEETLQKLTEYFDGLPEVIDTHPDYDISYAMGNWILKK
jgi:hypothetical protein